MFAKFAIFACKDSCDDECDCITPVKSVEIAIDPAYADLDYATLSKIYREKAVHAAGLALDYCYGCDEHKFTAEFSHFVDDPKTVVLSLSTLALVVEILNANARVSISRDASEMSAIRNALIRDGVIEKDNRTQFNDCAINHVNCV